MTPPPSALLALGAPQRSVSAGICWHTPPAPSAQAPTDPQTFPVTARLAATCTESALAGAPSVLRGEHARTHSPWR
eukprot:3106623-Rhodomonas_salina.1